ncbi:hypothetical protein ACVV4A_26075 [Escherichia coli]
MLQTLCKAPVERFLNLFNQDCANDESVTDSFELPPFSKILPEHVVPAVTKALNDCRENVERVVAQGAPYTWKISASRWRKWTMCWGVSSPGQPSELGEK